jgi:thiamine biosynthesis lipoprotein
MMKNHFKRSFSLYSLGLIILFTTCGKKAVKRMEEYNGYAQGTTFHIVYDESSSKQEIEEGINKIFQAMDRSLSLYDSTSFISRANRMKDTVMEVDEYFYQVFEKSKTVYRLSNGAFNPAIYPLIRYWGFGTGKIEHPEETRTATIDSLKAISRFEDCYVLQKDGKYLFIKKNKYVQLDFNAIAQGYTVDVIAEFLDKRGIQNYMIEVGGEVRARGVNGKYEIWKIGIDKPVGKDEPRSLIAIARLHNKALATSGSYRKFYEKNGVKFSHTIDPITGYPVQHSLISASIFAPTCAEADAYATACMVMGPEKCKAWISNLPDVSAYLIFGNYKGEWNTWLSDDLKDQLEMLKEGM